MVKVKNFFKKVGLWFKNHAPTKRRLIQVYAALLTNANLKGFIDGKIYTGNLASGGSGGTKNLCVPGLNCYSCPGAVGACPLGALQDSLANSDTTVPFYILGILGLFGLICARTICGFFCPVGLGQELLYKIKTPKLKKSRYTRLLSYLKYVLLIVLVIAIPLIYHGIPAFCKYICPAGTFGGAGGLLTHPSNAGYFDQLGYLFTWKFALLVGFIIACIFIYRCFCRFFCPLGAIYGFFNKIALLGVKLDKRKCVDCGLCIQTCKMDIKHVGDHECINCGDCIPVCPTQAISWKGSKLVLAGLTVGLNESEEEEAQAPVLAALAAGGADAAVPAGSGNATVTAVMPENIEQPATEEKPRLTVEKRIKRRAFWLQFGAWAAAIAVLVSALVYYNFIYKEQGGGLSDGIYSVGDICPDFTFDTVYDTAGGKDENGSIIESVGLSDLIGKNAVTVINFWYTLCDPCIAELPDFNKIKQDYGERVNVVVVHINNGASDNSIQKRIDGLGWSDWGLTFVHDDLNDSLFAKLGGKNICPMTVILDREGEITFNFTGNLSEKTYEGMPLLDYEVEQALGK